MKSRHVLFASVLTLYCRAVAADVRPADEVHARQAGVAATANGSVAHGHADKSHPAELHAASAHTAGAHAEASHAEGAHAESHGGHHEREPFNFADFGNKKTTPYLALLINLAILAAIYVKVGKKPVAEALQKRKEGIAKDIEEAAKRKKEAEERAKKYQADLANIDKDSELAKKALEDAGKIERDKLVTEARQKAERMKKDAAFLLEQEEKQTKIDLMQSTIEKATDDAILLLKEKVTPEDHARIADEFLKELAAKPAFAGAQS